MSSEKISGFLAGLVLLSGKDKTTVRPLAALWCLRNEWQREKRPELLTAFVFAKRYGRASNHLKLVRLAAAEIRAARNPP
jgi:hypothetical protein